MEPRGPRRFWSPTPIMTPDNAFFVSHLVLRLSNLPPTSLPVLYPQYLGGGSPQNFGLKSLETRLIFFLHFNEITSLPDP